MKNGDLKRFYPVNPNEDTRNSFARYDENGNLPGGSGEAGKDALVCSAIYQPETNPSVNQYITLNSSYYNRTPVINEYYPLIWKGTNNRSFVCMMKVNSIPGSVSSQVISFLETTGAQGATSKLYCHSISWGGTNGEANGHFYSSQSTITSAEFGSLYGGMDVAVCGRAYLGTTSLPICEAKAKTNGQLDIYRINADGSVSSAITIGSFYVTKTIQIY